MIIFKVTMGYPDGSWVVMDSGTEKKMKIILDWYREHMAQRKFRLEKHTVEVVD